MKSEACRFGGGAVAARFRWRPGVVGGVQVHKSFAFVSGLLALIWWVTASAQIQQQWVVRYRGPQGSDSVARAMVLDAATNILVTGGSYGEFATVKYDSNGNEIWEARYRGPGQGDNFARAIAVDRAGNIYVTGWSYGANNNFDYATVKYDPNGNQLWVARYNGPENTNDFARAIALDKAGNVYVTGTSGVSMDEFDEQGDNGTYTTIKYDPNGNQLWVARYAGEMDDGFRDSQAYAVAVDQASNVYVTGYSTGSATFYDFCTIKYDASGNQLWLARYDGPAHGLEEAYSMALDSAGNVYVTGGSNGDTSYDYATVKYDTNGKQLWVARYNGPADSVDEANAIAVDSAGNVYVTGDSTRSQFDEDMATIKYNADGNDLWVARFGGSASDKAFAITLDNTGNVYVAGYGDAGRFGGGFNYQAVEYDGDGHELWSASYAGPGSIECGGDLDNVWAIAVDGAGNVYVTGETSVCASGGRQYGTIKYGATPVSQLPPTITEQPESQSVLGGGRVTFETLATGATPLAYQWLFNGTTLANATNLMLTLTNIQAANAGDYRVVVLNAFGSATSIVAHLTVKPTETPGVQRAWVARYSASTNTDERASAIAVDLAGNAYVAGVITPYRGSETDYVLVKYAPDGHQLWEARSGSPGDSQPGSSLAIDQQGGVYVADSSGLRKYDGNGIRLWGAAVIADSIALDGAGSVYMTSRFETLKYDANGNQLWATPPTNALLVALAVDGNGNVFVTGPTFTGAFDYNSSDYFTSKYDSNGQRLWVARYNGPASKSEDRPSAIAVDSAGNVYVTGYSTGNILAGQLGYSTIKYDQNGSQLWVARYTYGGNTIDEPVGIGVDGSGNVYITGRGSAFNSSTNFFTIKYDRQGTPIWIASYNSEAQFGAVARAMKVDSAGDVYAAGAVNPYTALAGYAVVKYDSNGSLVWSARYSGPAGGADEPTALALDQVGNVYVTGGSSGGASSGGDFATIKYVQTPAVPWLVSPTLLSNGQFQLTLIAEAGKTYDIQSSPDLKSWTSLTNFVSAMGVNQFTDTTVAKFSRRFYRAVSP